MMLHQQQISVNARTKGSNSTARPFSASTATRTRSHLSRQTITCQALPSSRPDTQQDSGASAGPLQVIAAAAAAAAVLLWPAQAAQALPEAQLEQIKQAIDKDFQQGQVSAVPLAMSAPAPAHKGQLKNATAGCLNCRTSVCWEMFSVAWCRDVFCCL